MKKRLFNDLYPKGLSKSSRSRSSRSYQRYRSLIVAEAETVKPSTFFG